MGAEISGEVVTGDADAGDTDAVQCCPIGTPSCDCTPLGGSPSQPGGCGSVCDAVPVGWTEGVDENGCPFLVPAAGSCLDPTDVTDATETPDTADAPDTPDTNDEGEVTDDADASDAEVGMDEGPETGDDADVTAGGDADGETAGDDADAGANCCPIAESPSCDCSPTGGSPDQPGGCHSICDAAPPAWTMSVDANGCPVWEIGAESCL